MCGIMIVPQFIRDQDLHISSDQKRVVLLTYYIGQMGTNHRSF